MFYSTSSRVNIYVKQRRSRSVVWCLSTENIALFMALYDCHRHALKISGVESPSVGKNGVPSWEGLLPDKNKNYRKTWKLKSGIRFCDASTNGICPTLPSAYRNWPPALVSQCVLIATVSFK